MPSLVLDLQELLPNPLGVFDALVEYEPDLAAISEENPLPSYPMTREIRVVLQTIKLGAKAKMPEHLLLEDEEEFDTLPVAQPIQPQVGMASARPAENSSIHQLLQNIMQSSSLAALIMPQVAAPAPVPQPPAPGVDLLTAILLQALQQNNQPALPNYNGADSLFNGIPAQLRPQLMHRVSGISSYASTPSLSSSESLLQSLQNPHAAPVPVAHLSNMAPIMAPTIQNSNAHTQNTANGIPSFTTSQLHGMSTAQLQALLNSINQRGEK